MADVANLTAGFSHHDPEMMQNPYPLYAEARGRCPVAHSDALGGFYFVMNYDQVKKVYSDYKNFSSEEGSGLPAQPVKMYPIDLDPPQQTKYRKILNPLFTPEAVAAHRPRVEKIIDDLIDSFIEDGAADLGARLVRPALSATVLPMLGVPLEDQPMVAEKLDYMVRYRTTDPAGAERCGQEMAVYLMGLAAKRRQSPPKDDILQTLMTVRVDGALLTDDQIFRVLIIILFGGLDTTSAAIGEAIVHMSGKPGDAERLRSGEVPWATAIEEFIRYTSPIQGLRRTVRHPIELESQPLQPGDRILALNAAANRDPSRFSEPDTCLIDRRDNEHLAFGVGAHICLGRFVARLVMEVMLKAVLDRLPGYRMAADFAPEYAVGEARGLKALPVTFTPGYRRTAA